MIRLLLALPLLLASCATHPDTVDLATLPAAAHVQRSGTPRSVCVFDDSLSDSERAALLPFAVLHASGTDLSREGLARLAWRKDVALQHGTEVLLIADAPGTLAAGTDIRVDALGAGWVRHLVGVCCVRSRTDLGFRHNTLGVVTQVSPGTAAADAGLQLSDSVLSLDGLAYEFGQRWYASPHFQALATKGPGASVTLAWTRAGAAMSGSGKLTEAPAGALASMRSSVRWVDETPSSDF